MKRVLVWVLFIAIWLGVSYVQSHADLSPLELREEDGSPSVFPYQVKVTNGTLTDNGDGTASIATGGGGVTVGGTITGGTDTRVLFDDAGAVGEDAGFTFTKATDLLVLGENGQDGSLRIYSEQGATDRSTTFQPGTQLADITYTLPTYLVSGAVLTVETDGTLQFQPDDGGAAGTGDLTDIIAGTAIDVADAGGPSPTVSWDSTEVEATTWGAGGNASNVWTFNTTGTDTTITLSSATAAFSHALTVNGLTTANANLAVRNGASPSVLTMYEATGDGTNSVSFQPPALASDTDYTYPTAENLVSGYVLTFNDSGILMWEPDNSGGGAGNPGGSNTQVQFNDSSSFGGSADFTWANSTSIMTVSGTVIVSEEPIPSTPSSGYGTLYAKGDGKPYFRNDGGTEYDLTVKPPKEYWWTASALEPLEAADSIPPVSKFTGTNSDILTLSFDDSTDEGRKVSFKVPSDVDTSGTVRFRVLWFSRTATTGNVIWDARNTSTGAEGESWDGALTTQAAAADAVQGTTNQMTVTTWTQSVTSLGWAANDLITSTLYRDANHASDTLVGDAEVVGLGIEVPRT